jgi:hypothetical protein
MKKLYNSIWEILPVLWGMLLVAIITIGSVGILVFVIKWFLSLVGVI